MPFFHFSWKKHKKRDEWAKLDKAGGKCVDSWKPKPEWDLSHQFLNRLPETVVKAGMFIVFVTRWMSIYRASLMVPSIIQWPVLKHPPCRTREKIKRTQHKPSVKSGKCVVHFRDTESLNTNTTKLKEIQGLCKTMLTWPWKQTIYTVLHHTTLPQWGI